MNVFLNKLATFLKLQLYKSKSTQVKVPIGSKYVDVQKKLNKSANLGMQYYNKNQNIFKL